MVTRVRRGLYLVPRYLPSGRWSPTEAEALTTLMADCGGQYQVCGLNAFNRYGWDEQVPNRVCAYNDKLSGDLQIGPVSLLLYKISSDRIGSVDLVGPPGEMPLRYSSRARALLDAVYDWRRF